MNNRELFQRLILMLPDGRFFDIMRNYLGKIKTPFHKPDLISRLTGFLLKEETQRRIIAALSDSDIRVLSAVDFLGTPEPRQLFYLLADTEDTFALHHHLMNLEYRLLIFTDTSGSAPLIRCNPLFEELLKREVVDSATLFPSFPPDNAECEISTTEAPWLQEALVTAFLSYIDQNPECLRADGSLKKRQDREVQKLFALLSEKTGLGSRFSLLMNSCTAAGLLIREGTSLTVRWENCSAFFELDRMDRLCYLWSGADPNQRGRNPKSAAAVKHLVSMVTPARLFREASLRRLTAACFLREGEGESGKRGIFELCRALGIFIDTGKGLCRSSRLFVPEEKKHPENSYIIQQNMHITVKPEVPFQEAVWIARAAEIRKYDIYSEYELTKESFNRFMDSAGHQGQNGAERLFLLPETLPRNVSVRLREWEEEYKKICFYEGIVLTVHESLRHLVDHNPAVQEYVRAAPAPGVYIFDREEYSKWSEALLRAGIEYIPSPGGIQRHTSREDYQALLSLPAADAAEVSAGPEVEGNRRLSRRDGLVKELMKHLGSMKVSKEAFKELEARIEKGYILFPEQLETETVLESKPSEAKGIDFMGKVRLIEQAVSSGKDVLELIERSAGGDPRRFIVSPDKLDRKGEELILHGKELPEGRLREIQVRKLSLVRKLESIIFAPQGPDQ